MGEEGGAEEVDSNYYSELIVLNSSVCLHQPDCKNIWSPSVGGAVTHCHMHTLNPHKHLLKQQSYGESHIFPYHHSHYSKSYDLGLRENIDLS